MKKLLLLILLISTSLSAQRTITEVQRDSIYSKIIRGKEAIEDNKILRIEVKKRDSVIKLHTETIGIQELNLSRKDKEITDLNTIISNQKVMLKNEVKRGRRRGWFGILKGGAIMSVIFFILSVL